MISPRPDVINSKPCPHRTEPIWTREQIRTARRVALAPLLHRRGLALRDRGGGNMESEHYKGLLLKASYWRWPEHDMAGNAIDFFVKVLGTSFNDAMKEILGGEQMPRQATPIIAIRSERGYPATKVDASPAVRPTAP